MLITHLMYSFGIVSLENPNPGQGMTYHCDLDSARMVCHLSRAVQPINDEGFGKLLEDRYGVFLHGGMATGLSDDLVNLGDGGQQ
jgi:hypothetical protein